MSAAAAFTYIYCILGHIKHSKDAAGNTLTFTNTYTKFSLVAQSTPSNRQSQKTQREKENLEQGNLESDLIQPYIEINYALFATQVPTKIKKARKIAIKIH